MKTTKAILLGTALFVAGMLAGNLDISTGTAQEAYPTEHKGISITKIGGVPEESMIKQTGLEGYFLRLRLATLDPGGQIARHDHATRPGLVYTLEGSWVEGRPEGEREYPAGEEIALVEDAETDHWFYNPNEEPVKVVICDLGHVK
jgi:quercetin dioxygenase-like cupin family protein